MEENKKEKDEIKEEKNTVEEKDEQTKLKDTIYHTRCPWGNGAIDKNYKLYRKPSNIPKKIINKEKVVYPRLKSNAL